MAVIDNFLGRWLRRNRLFFLLGLVLVSSIQLYLAYKSAKLPLTTPTTLKNGGDDKSSNYLPLKPKGDDRSRPIVNSAFVDDEDVHSNSNTYSRIMQKSAGGKSNRRAANSHENARSTALKLEDLSFTPACKLRSKEAISAVHRAKSEECKRTIVDTACAIQLDQFYAKALPNFCPHANFTPNLELGCYKDEKSYRLLSGYYVNYKASNSPKKCIRTCLQSGFLYAGVQYSSECFCGSSEPLASAKLPDSSCNMKCPGDSKDVCGGYFTMNVFETGIASKLKRSRNGVCFIIIIKRNAFFCKKV